MAGAGFQVKGRKLELLLPGLPCSWKGSKHLGHPLLSLLGHQQGAESGITGL